MKSSEERSLMLSKQRPCFARWAGRGPTERRLLINYYIIFLFIISHFRYSLICVDKGVEHLGMIKTSEKMKTHESDLPPTQEHS